MQLLNNSMISTMPDKSILDLPNEIIRDFLFKYLEVVEIFILGEAGNHRLKELSQEYLGYSKGNIITDTIFQSSDIC